MKEKLEKEFEYCRSLTYEFLNAKFPEDSPAYTELKERTFKATTELFLLVKTEEAQKYFTENQEYQVSFFARLLKVYTDVNAKKTAESAVGHEIFEKFKTAKKAALRLYEASESERAEIAEIVIGFFNLLQRPDVDAYLKTHKSECSALLADVEEVSRSLHKMNKNEEKRVWN